MGAHSVVRLAVSSTPVAVEKYKTTDSNRNPDTNIQPKADVNRKNAMRDCPETTILMHLSQFFGDCLYNLAADFDTVFDRKHVPSVWLSFQAKLGKIAQPAGKVGQERKKPLEKDVSLAWVCPHCLYDYHVVSTTAAQSDVDAQHHMCPNHFLNLSEERPDANDDTKYKVDASFISNEHEHIIVPRKPNWPYIRVLIEFKRGGTSNDPFDDKPGHDPDATATSRVSVRGQLLSYGEHLFAYQHRVAVYLLFVNGDFFRVMRWDRSGVIVTEAINYVSTMKGTKALLMVTYALSKLNLEQLGFDLNVTLLSPSSCGYQRMDLLARLCSDDLDYREHTIDASTVHKVFIDAEYAESFGALLDGQRALLHLDPSHDCDKHASCHNSSPPIIPVLSFIRRLWSLSLASGYPRYVIKLEDRHYLVGKHIFIGFGLVGRGTRGYIALEWETQRFVFLKDSWRPYYDELEEEGDVLSKLNAEKILNVPTVLRYGDVHYTMGDKSEQETETSHYSPLTGGKEVDHTRYPKFAPDPKEEAALKKWLQSKHTNVDSEPPAVYQTMAATWQPGHDSSSDHEFNPLEDTIEAASMPELQAGPLRNTNTSQPPSSHIPTGVKRSADAVEREDHKNQGAGLRHMVHTRMVVKEVCLPMTEFTSSFQLTNLIYECILGTFVTHISMTVHESNPQSFSSLGRVQEMRVHASRRQCGKYPDMSSRETVEGEVVYLLARTSGRLGACEAQGQETGVATTTDGMW